MKKTVMAFLMIVFSIALFAQEFSEYKSENFLIKYSGSKNKIQNIISYSEEFNKSIESLLRLKNSDNLREILILEDYPSYISYLKNIGLEPREDYVFLEYSNNENRVVMYNSDDILTLSLAHHLALQYVDFYGYDTPYWLSLGIATYFEDFNLETKLKSSYKWVNTLKITTTKEKVFTTILSRNSRNQYKNYNTWLLVDYLINTDNKDHNRLLWDTLSRLKYNESENNSVQIKQDFLKYDLDKELLIHLNSIVTYSDYIKLGVEAYGEKEYLSAIESLTEAVKLEPALYSSDYYLGLCYSSIEEYAKAYSHFSTALDKGAPEGLVFYSIGINFYRAKNFQDAEKYLTRIEDEKYKLMGEKVLDEIRKY